ncbi:hypothetical protein MKZ38_006502 [Zalerion maritima]|uniref:Kri1-like C-terminal domain-containing protein n=1 Tax=Zalerion maritima TaxID=339359 RepID=A0AAD5RZV8_9PEZI|nr:hypothetical protein MKZ38_006502 [Zalerion maritima]
MPPDNRQSLFDDESDGEGVSAPEFKVNKEYARRFEHNKKREEIHRLEEKYKKGNADEEGDESSDSESEDEDAFLATEQVDAEINAVLNAIKNKDPKLKDKSYKWYKSLDEAETDPTPKPKEEKPVTLRDYHRINLLKTVNGEDEEELAGDAPKTYVQEQEEIKKAIAEEVAKHDDESDDGEDFFRAKEKPKALDAASGVHPSRAAKMVKKEGLPDPDQDPEAFLMSYASSRAWVSEDKDPNWAAFNSDDEDEDNRMEQIEHAFNMRFEDPEKSNDIIRTYARTDGSVRRNKATARQSKREQEKELKAAEKKERHEERARLRRLKIEESEEKLRKIKEAAGMSGKAIADEDLMKLLDDAWDDDKWEEAMKDRFGDSYYAEEDAVMGERDEAEGEKKKKPKKPKWDDDIDIKDLVPDFEDNEKLTISLTDVEDDDEEDGGALVNAGRKDDEEVEEASDDDEEASESQKRRSNKDRKRERQEAKSKARRERVKLEALVDSKMELDDPTALKTNAGGRMAFRYRETSPSSFGLTARDILLAPSDQALNEFAGLKKYATWRDEEKKKRDRKKLGKKARLKQWRKETYGDQFTQTGPTFGFEKLIKSGGGSAPLAQGPVAEKNYWEKKEKKRQKRRTSEDKTDDDAEVQGEQEGKNKKKRRRKNKKSEVAA